MNLNIKSRHTWWQFDVREEDAEDRRGGGLRVKKHIAITSQHPIPANISAKNEKLYHIYDTRACLQPDSSPFPKDALISIAPLRMSNQTWGIAEGRQRVKEFL